jgi:hypothetical protein
VYPNPVLDKLSITGAANSELQIFDLTGKKLLHLMLGENSSHVDFSSFAAGIYNIQIMQNGTVIYQEKLVK